MSLLKKIKSSGPAAIITSAFIGPGTVIVSTKVGISFGYSIVWAVVFAVISLMILMEMSSRIAIISKKDLIEATISVIPNSNIWKRFIQILMVIAVLTVCFAFQTGNLVGGSLGLSTILGINKSYIIILMAFISFCVSILGNSKLLEIVMKMFVSVMGIIFFLTLLFVKPNFLEISKGLIPNIPKGGYVLTLALIGTTLIGINLILHSITSKEKWNDSKDLNEAKWDIIINILIGGVITFSIVVISATLLKGKQIEGNPALFFTKGLEVILGKYASVMGNLGLFSAGLSSAIAIPFTLKNIIARVFNFKEGANDIRAKVLGVIVILFGTILALIGRNPQEIIILAQATSGFFLPLITILILIVANDKKLLGVHTNKLWQNIVGIVVVLLTFALGIKGIIDAITGLMNLIK